jgi:hypothetical protein
MDKPATGEPVQCDLSWASLASRRQATAVAIGPKGKRRTLDRQDNMAGQELQLEFRAVVIALSSIQSQVSQGPGTTRQPSPRQYPDAPRPAADSGEVPEAGRLLRDTLDEDDGDTLDGDEPGPLVTIIVSPSSR